MKQFRIVGILALVTTILASCSQKETLIPVSLNGKWGYMNTKGEYVIAPQYKDANYFHEGLALVKTMDGNVGYIDKNANFVIPPKYKDGTIFNEGAAIIVERGKKPLCIDPQGNALFSIPTAEEIYTFHEDLAAFKDTSGKYGFVNKSGAVVIPPKFEDIAVGFQDGLAPVLFEGKWGFINKEGRMVISHQFDSVGLFNSDLAFAQIGRQYGFIGKNGLFSIDPQFENAASFSEKRASARLGGRYGVIKTNGKLDVNPLYDEISAYHNGLARMKLNNMFGYLDNNGNMVVNAQFADATDFLGEVAVAKTFDQYNQYKYGVINKKGQFISFPNIDDVKNDNYNIPESLNYVANNYYDATEFVKNFTKKISKITVDGFSGKTSLLTIANSVLYGDYANDIDTVTVLALNEQKITKDISIAATAFHFASAIYKNSTADAAKVYSFDALLSGVEYSFALKHNAYDKGAALSEAVAKELASKLGVEYKTLDKVIYALQEDGKCSFAIIYTDETMTMYFTFNKQELQKILEKYE